MLQFRLTDLLIVLTVLAFALFLNLIPTDIGSGETVIVVGWPYAIQTAIENYGPAETPPNINEKRAIVSLPSHEHATNLYVVDVSWSALLKNVGVAMACALVSIIIVRRMRSWMTRSMEQLES